MAYHSNTPASVLNAPLPTVAFLVEHTYPPRKMRRSAHTRTGRRVFIPKSQQTPAFNTPYVKPRGLTLVGESGPELRSLPEGAQVLRVGGVA